MSEPSATIGNIFNPVHEYKTVPPLLPIARMPAKSRPNQSLTPKSDNLNLEERLEFFGGTREKMTPYSLFSKFEQATEQRFKKQTEYLDEIANIASDNEEDLTKLLKRVIKNESKLNTLIADVVQLTIKLENVDYQLNRSQESRDAPGVFNDNDSTSSSSDNENNRDAPDPTFEREDQYKAPRYSDDIYDNYESEY